MVNTTDSEDEIFFRAPNVKNNEDWLDASNSKIGCRQNFTDCSNVFKAFIGSALIGLPFAVLQAGIGLSIIGIAVIAIITDHCCDLIVRCKRMVISNIMKERIAQGIDEVSRKEEEILLGKTLSFGRIGRACMGTFGVLAVNISVVITQFGFTIGYFIFMGNTLRSIFKQLLVQPLPLPTNMTMNTTIAPTTPSSLLNTRNISASISTGFVVVNTSSVFQSLHHTLHTAFTSAANPFNSSNLNGNSSFTFTVLILFPLPLLVGIAFVRNLRKLGPVSVIANVSITSACFATIVFMIATVVVDHKGLAYKEIDWFKFSTFPIFFGQVTGAFEGIGTVIPIEGSMAENRHKYPCFLHISMIMMSFILASFGITGYISYGNDTCQIVTQNLRGDIAIALQLMLFIGVLFTYPLQLYPNIQIAEQLYLRLKRWRVKRKRRTDIMKKNSEEGEGLLNNSQLPDEVAVVRVKNWEGNLLRMFLVIFTAAFALIFRSQFAYIAALTGSVGSSLLSYILPPLFHNSLKRQSMSRAVFIKNYILVAFGVILGLMGLTITIQEIIQSFKKGHQAHC